MIEGLRIHLHGRMAGLTRREAARLLEARGATLARRPGAADACAVAHSCALAWQHDPLRGVDLPLVSELALRRALGLRPPLPAQARPFAAAEVALHAGLDGRIVRDLAAFDVLESDDGSFAFPEVAVARQAARLLAGGIALPALLEAGAALSSAGRRLTSAALREAPWGGLVVVEGGSISSLDGQLALDLGEPSLRYAEIFDIAQECETEGDLDEAERLYRIAALLSPADGTALFNLGNVLAEQGRRREALAAYLGAAARDRSVAADSHYNAAILCREAGRPSDAEFHYRAALRFEPAHRDAAHNWALLLMAEHRCAEALPLWESLARDGDAAARRQARLCRLELLGKEAAFA